MANVVSIQIQVNDNGSVSVIGANEQALVSLGKAGATAGTQVAQGMQQIGGHTTTSLDQVRLLSQEFGLRLPRAMEAALSRMPGIISGLASISSGLLAVGAAEVFVRMGTAIYDAEQKYVSITAAANKYYETLKKTSELDFTNTHSLATTQMRLDQATQTMSNAPGAAQSMQRAGLAALLGGLSSGTGAATGIGMIAGAQEVAGQGALAAQRTVELTKTQLDQQHQQALRQIEINHALDGTLQRRQAINAATTKTNEVAAENTRYSRRVEQFYGDPAPGDAGAAEASQATAQARAEAAAKTIDLNNEVSVAAIKAQSQANQVNLQGEALYEQKRKDGIRELTAELNAQHLAEEIPARVKALNAQYDGERLQRLRDLTAETQRLNAEAATAGLTGAAKIFGERDASLAEIDARQKKFTGGAAASPEVQAQFDQQRADAAAVANAKLLTLQSSFTDHVNALVANRVEAETFGFEKIQAAAEKEVQALQKTYNEDFANAQLTADQKLQAERNLQAGKDAINAAADAQRRQLAARNRADDLQFDREADAAEARVRSQGLFGWTATYRNAITEIQAQEQQRLARLDEDATREGLTAREVAQRRVDIERSANAEIAAQNQQVQHEIAGTLQQAFTNPTEFIKQKMEQMFFEIVASWIMRLNLFKGVFGQTMGGLQPAAASGGGVLSQVFGIGGTVATHPMQTSGTSLTGTAAGGFSPAAIGGSSSSTVEYVDSSGSRAGGDYEASGHGGGAISSISGAVNQGESLSRQLGIKFPGMSSATSLPSNTGSQASSSTSFSSMSFADNGEGGGFSGYMTGDTQPMVDAEAGSIGAEASAQAQAANRSDDAGGASAMGYAGAAIGVATGGKGVYDSIFQGGVKGALNGTLAGAEAGLAIGSLFGSAGAVIGAATGATIGLATNLVADIFGVAGHSKAREYYRKSIFPEMEGIEKSFTSGGSGDYMSAISQANNTSSQGYYYMAKNFGQDAADWVKANYLNKETNKVVGDITRLAGSGRNTIGLSAAEFHDGGIITGFGDFATSSTEGYVHAKIGEGYVHDRAMRAHGPHIAAINAGADEAEMAQRYIAASSGSSRAGGGVTHQHQWNVSALDAGSFERFLDGGGMQAVNRASSRFASRYAGDGIG